MIRSCLTLFTCLLALTCLAQKENITARKLSPGLLQKIVGFNEADTLRVTVGLTHNDPVLMKHWRLKEIYAAGGIYHGRLTGKEILALRHQQGVVFINEFHLPAEELNTGAVDYTLNKINQAHHGFPSINGDSIFIVIKERAFDSTDIDVKGRVYSTGIAASGQTAHASVMATIIAGAGNSSPFALGVAPSGYVGSVDFANLFPAQDTFYQQKRLSVENHSYGTVVENFYGNEAAAYDISAVNNPHLLSVFSAGNAGTSSPATGNYAGLPAVANLTGNFKQSKNTIAVTGLDSSGASLLAASRGPAYDGRIKPELSAYGEDGSSGAAALVSGTAALIQQAYKKNYSGLPAADLVKAILINSADDAGAKGIDYVTGYGSLNAYKAIGTVIQNRFFQNTVVQDEVKTFPITVPSNISQIKVTLAWIDPAAQPPAGKALINDLDVVLRETASGQAWQPWVLNPAANKDSLRQPAQRKRDTLNNVEQITIDTPVAGNYQVEVRGTKLISAQQKFALCFQLDTASTFLWTYPTSSDPLISGTTHVVRWNTTFGGNGGLEYSVDGTGWQQLSNSINLAGNHYKWTVPDTVTTALLRMVVGQQQFPTDTFVISPQMHLQVGYNCIDSFLLFWKQLPAEHYAIAQLGDRYLETVRTTADTAIIIKKQLNPSRYFSVTPIVQNRRGMRSNSLAYDAAGVDCYFVSFYLQSQTPDAAVFFAELGTLFNVKELSLQKLTPSGYVTLQTFRSITTIQMSFSDSALLKGENYYRLQLILTNGAIVYSDVEKVYHFADSPVYVYPNPARQNEQLKIISTEAGRYTVSIVNSKGAEVYRQFITNSFISMAAAPFPKGLYFIRISGKEGKSFVQKLIIQ